MKRFIPILSIAFVFAACTSTPPPANTQAAAITVQPDTAGMAAYQQWKASNELSNLVAYEQAAAATAAPVKQAVQKAPVRKTTTPAKTTQPKTSTSTSGSSDVAQGSGTSTSSGEAKAEEKKKISKAAKGAVIGGVAGAAGGAILNKKNRVMGAVIGGVIGAAGGYGIGRGMDKKDGRFEYQLK